MEIRIWCPECCEFHKAERDPKYGKPVYVDKCGHIVWLKEAE